MTARPHTDLEARFDAAMLEIYWIAGRASGYWAGYFLRDVRKLGGLATARKLLQERGVSSGFERLSHEGRLDLSMEALVLRPQYRALFSDDELDLARSRLADHGFAGDDRDDAAQAAPEDLPPALLELVEAVELASGLERIDYRDRFVAFGGPARHVAAEWLASEHLTGFAVAVLERQAASDPLAARALERYAMQGGRDQRLATSALDRVKGSRLARPRPARDPVDVYMSTGAPEAEIPGGCQIQVGGRPCANPGRHVVDGTITCTTHRKSIERASGGTR